MLLSVRFFIIVNLFPPDVNIFLKNTEIRKNIALFGILFYNVRPSFALFRHGTFLSPVILTSEREE